MAGRQPHRGGCCLCSVCYLTAQFSTANGLEEGSNHPHMCCAACQCSKHLHTSQNLQAIRYRSTLQKALHLRSCCANLTVDWATHPQHSCCCSACCSGVCCSNVNHIVPCALPHRCQKGLVPQSSRYLTALPGGPSTSAVTSAMSASLIKTRMPSSCTSVLLWSS
jgi:hypothetical protein